MKHLYLKIIVATIILGSAGQISFSQSSKDAPIPKCKIPDKIGGKYKLLFTIRNDAKDDKTLSLFVFIKPSKINREYLLEFVNRIRQEYCNEKSLLVEIFEDEKNAGIAAVYYYKLKKVADVGYRGEYIMNKDQELEVLRFSTKRGNPIDEIKINLKVSAKFITRGCLKSQNFCFSAPFVNLFNINRLIAA